MVRKTGLGFLLSLLFVLFAYTPAVAENYFGLRTGASIQDYTDVNFENPRITTGLKTDNSNDTAALISLQLGKTLSASARTRVELEYAQSTVATFDRFYNDFPTTLQRITIKSRRVMANGYFNLGNVKMATVYLSAGVGVAINRADAIQGSASEFDDDTKTDFAWSAGAGLSRVLTDIWSVDFGYRYVDLGDADTGISEFTPFDEHFEGELDTHEITLGMRASF